MPLIDPESTPVKKEQLNVRVDPSVAEMLRNYCDFLKSSSQHHVVEQLLRYAFSPRPRVPVLAGAATRSGVVVHDSVEEGGVATWPVRYGQS